MIKLYSVRTGNSNSYCKLILLVLLYIIDLYHTLALQPYVYIQPLIYKLEFICLEQMMKYIAVNVSLGDKTFSTATLIKSSSQTITDLRTDLLNALSSG